MVRSGLLSYTVFALAIVIGHAASAAPEINHIGNTGWGRLNSAVDVTPMRLKALVGLNYARTRNVLGSGDVLQMQGLNLHFAYDITRNWGAGLGASLQGVADSQFYNGGAGAATLFDAFGTWHHMVSADWGLGALLRLEIPSGFSGLGVVMSDLALRIEGLATWHASEWFNATYTLGYVYDRRNLLIATFNPIQRLLFDAGPAHRLSVGAGASGWVPPVPWVSLGWFAQVFGEWSTASGPLGPVDSPVALGLGVRASPWSVPNLLVSLGCDLGLSGKVTTQGPYPGLFPWNLYLQVALQLDAGHTDAPPPPRHVARPICEAIPTRPPPCSLTPGRHCPPPPTCVPDPNAHRAIDSNARHGFDPNARHAFDPNARRAPVADPIKVVPVPVANPGAARGMQVMLSGFVLDLAGAPAPGAVVTSPLYPDVRFAANPTAGYFRLPPLSCDGNRVLELVFSAKNMIHQTRRFACTQPVLPAYTAKLEHGRDVDIGEVTFIIRINGKMPQEEVLVHLRRGHQRSVYELEADGSLQLRLRTGIHHATIAAKGYEKRVERFALGANEHVILNIELSPDHKPGRQR